MIISNLTGGLGNQMFQYAFGRYLAIKNNVELKLHFTNALFNTQYSYALGVFNIKAKIASEKDLKKLNVVQHRAINRLLFLFDERFGIQFNKNIITQKFPYKFDEVYQNIKDNTYIQGYWTNEQYFRGIEDTLRNEFTLKNPLDEKNRKIVQEMKSRDSISVHVRRGDYVTNKANAQSLGFLGLKYYKYAINKINSTIRNPHFYVFSDDIDWCKLNLSFQVKNVTFINHNTGSNSYKDLLLMSTCKHSIIANSTFSWWGNWLNCNVNKITISP